MTFNLCITPLTSLNLTSPSSSHASPVPLTPSSPHTQLPSRLARLALFPHLARRRLALLLRLPMQA